jgi:ferredoxin
VVLVTSEEAPQYLDGLQAQMDVAQAHPATGLGYTGVHLQLHARHPPCGAGRGLQALGHNAPATPPVPAAALPSRRKARHAGAGAGPPGRQAPLPVASGPRRSPCRRRVRPLGTIEVDKDRCTLCLSCVSACPASALQDNPQLPQLRFIEKNCVQCGLCATHLPGRRHHAAAAPAAHARARAGARAQRSQPYACVRCGKPFGTVKAIEAMLGKLAGHAMFQGEALERLKMCSDCRVIDLYSAHNERK